MAGRERRKGEVPMADKVPGSPPNVKKFKQSLAELTEKIRDKESQRKRLNVGGRTSAQVNGELNKTTSELQGIGQHRTNTAAEVRQVEDEVKSLGPEISSKKGDASRLLVGLRYKSTDRIEDALSKLRQKLLTRQFSETEGKRLQSEIDTLENSKEELREYLKTKAEIDEMIQKQEKLRERRNSLYKKSRELRSREGEVKDRQTQLKKELTELRDKKKDLQEQKDALTEEIDALYKERQKLRDDFKRAQSLYMTANSEMEMEERERESVRRHEERRERRRRQAQEAELRREMKYEEEKTNCKTLISHLERLVEPSLTAITVTSNGGPGLDPLRSYSSPAAPGAPLHSTAPGRGGSGFQEPGQFLPRKTDDLEGYLVPSSSSKRKSRRDKKRHSAASGKATRPLQYDPVVLTQFEFLSVVPPTTHSQLPEVLRILREKLAFYEHKTSVYSEAGDSGIESQTVGDITEQDLHSQEDNGFDHTSPSRHPIPKSLSLTPDLSPPLSNGGLVATISPSSSSPLTPQAQEKGLQLMHSVSSSTTASNNSATALVQQSVE